jgi:hypothetical protein
MKLFFRLTSALLLLGTLAACALPGAIVPNTTTADELQKHLGKPSETKANPGGGEFWDYVYGPSGTETWRYGVDGGRVVRSKEQLLTDERLHKVVTGATTEAQVRELLGKPSQIMNLGMGPVWEWRVNLRPTMGFFFVSFDRKGLATSKGVLMDVAIEGDDRGSP